MAKPLEQKTQVEKFDVTCVVGTVYPTYGAGESPVAAAMLLIAEHDAEGRYSFPLMDGGTQYVVIERVGPDNATEYGREVL